MHKEVYDYLSKFSKITSEVDELIVSAFLEIGEYSTPNNIFLRGYDIRSSNPNKIEALNHLILKIKKHTNYLTIENLIELFEFVISPADKEVNGAVYTPKNIRSEIVEQTISKLEEQGVEVSTAIFGDISCGCGGFFYTLAEVLHNRFNKSYSDIFTDNIVGLDIEEYSVVRTKLLLSLMALSNDEDKHEYVWNLFVGDALQFKWQNECEIVKKNKGFHAVVGNPPYVGAVKLDAKTKELLKKWEVAKIGKADLYIPFFQIGLENLCPNGVLGFISVNSFFKSLNGIGLRKYISENNYDLTIVDFGGEQIFKGRTTYTCICIIQKIKTGLVKYTKIESRDIVNIKSSQFVSIEYNRLNNKSGWILDNERNASIIREIENTGKPLVECFDIRNGFATLRNNIYVFIPESEDSIYFYLRSRGDSYKIEKSICKPAIKPNILKTETDIQHKLEYIIFPYHLIEEKGVFSESLRITLKLFTESYFENGFPEAYKYLESFKCELTKRDNGNKTYENWYAYGRNQGLTFKGKKLLFPYISDHPYFVYTEREELLFYNGFAAISNDENDLKFIQIILRSRLFWFYLSHVSRPYENDYFSMGKRYLARFGVYQFTQMEKEELFNISDLDKIDEFIESKYRVIIPVSFVEKFKAKRQLNFDNESKF